jgi:carboxymethylenebutenolidase
MKKVLSLLVWHISAASICCLMSVVKVSIAAQPDAVTFPSGNLVLHGDLSKPEGTGPFPAVLWNHGGSNPRPGSSQYSESVPLGQIFASKGYVLFIPHRRGLGRSPRDSLVDQFVGKKQREVRNRIQLELMDIHMNDVIAALTYLKSLPYVDIKRIAMAGCSYGGSLTAFSSERDLGLRAAINFAGGALSWAQSPDLRERMLRSIRKANAPILLSQAENDYDLSPSRALSQELERLGKPHKLLIFPPFGTTPADGHGFCTRGGEIWAPEVFSFLSKTL